jgi:hypothetical protein
MGKGSKAGAAKAKASSPAERAVAEAYAALPATLAALAPFAQHKATGVQLQFADAGALPAERVAWVMQTLKRCVASAGRTQAFRENDRDARARSNMEPVFGAAEWPAQERTRQRDATAVQARYVFAHAAPAEDAAPDAASASLPLGFVHYRFVVEEEVPVLYVYEAQVTGACFPPRLRRLLVQNACAVTQQWLGASLRRA